MALNCMKPKAVSDRTRFEPRLFWLQSSCGTEPSLYTLSLQPPSRVALTILDGVKEGKPVSSAQLWVLLVICSKAEPPVPVIFVFWRLAWCLIFNRIVVLKVWSQVCNISIIWRCIRNPASWKSGGAIQQSLFEQALQVTVTHSQVWEPLQGHHHFLPALPNAVRVSDLCVLLTAIA